MELEQMLAKADKIADYYVKLQQKIFYLLIDNFKTTRPELINQDDPDSILEWRLRALAKIGALTKDTIRIVANTSGKAESYIYDLIKDDGLEVAKDINAELSDALKQNKPISPEVNSIVSSYAAQTFRDIDNNVNQSLLSTNRARNGAVRVYQDIINQTVLEVQTGLKTPDRALKDNIYKWRDNGIKTNLVDKAGHNWSLEGYTRTVIRTTTARTYNDLRIQSMKDFDSVLATMSSHPASRPACAPIQGKIVNIVPRESSRYDPEYPSIYDHGYGKPSGCFGINCGHKLYPYIKGVSHNFQKQYDPKEAIEKQKIQQKQRYYERNIRRLKYNLDLARRQNDVSSERKFNQTIRGYQAKLRDLVKDNDFLTRQYDREQIISPNRAVIEQFRQDIRYNMNRKKVVDKTSVPISRPELNRITKSFRKSGGKILMGPEIDERLSNIGAEASIIGDDLIMFSSKAGRAAIHEELIHAKQKRAHGEPKNNAEICKREIEAGNILLENSDKWKLTEQEIENTRLLIKKYTKDLEDLRDGE